MNSRSLDNEEYIVWEEDISRLDYVREMFFPAATRRRPVRWWYVGRRVGYAVLRPDARDDGYSGYFMRRVFFLKDYDRDRDPDGHYSTTAPFEAVDPRTVRPGQEGKLTSRTWGCPIFEEAS